MAYSKEDLRDLYEGTLPWSKTFEIMSKPKDDDRFDKYIEILQEHVAYPEKILMPLGDHLNVVRKGTERIVKCDCGHEFGDWRCNWKLSALVLARNDEPSLQEIFPGLRRPDPALCEVREYICPTCAVLLKVEAVPVGYPVIFDALPDIDGLYREWLQTPLRQQLECTDKSLDTIREWAKGRRQGSGAGG